MGNPLLGTPSGAAGVASFKSPGTASVRRGSVNANGMLVEGDELPPLKSTPMKGKLGDKPGAAPVEPPAGSQIPGLNYCLADFFPSHMEQVWNHYARPPDYKLIDKSGIKAMAEDCVLSFADAARKSILKDNPKWSVEKVDAKLGLLRGQFLPGSKHEDTVTIATHYLAHELKYVSAEDSKHSGVTKPCFFLHFQRAHRQLFSYTHGQPITLERELVVQKLNKQGVERANKGLKSLTTGKAASSAKQEMSIVSSRGTRSAKSRHKKGSSSKAGAMSMRPAKGENMFGKLDFDGPTPVAEGVGSLSSKQ